MKQFLVILLAGFCSSISAHADTLTNFDSLKTRAQITIQIPDTYHEVEIPFMRKIPHNFAIGSEDSTCQVRYWIQPLDTWVADYNSKSKKEKKNSMDPNALCKSMMMLAVMDASNNKSRDYQESKYPELTKTAYNANWEASAIVENGWPKTGFKYCYIWCLHKDNVADVYIYVLANKKEDFLQIVGKIAPLIEFKKSD
jgi:hypothetical protein